MISEGEVVEFSWDKVIQVLMFVLGGIVALLLFLQNQEIILINHDKLDNSFKSLTLYLTDTFDMIIQSNSLTVPVIVSVSAGFIIGFIKS
jgi:uncharacterized membrane protein (Fun14 family)